MVDLNKYGYGIWCSGLENKNCIVQTSSQWFHLDEVLAYPSTAVRNNGDELTEDMGWYIDRKIAGGMLTEW